MTDPVLAPDFVVTVDLRGETLIYEEPSRHRRTQVICTFGPEPVLSPRTLGSWWFPDERRSQALTEAEHSALIARLFGHARSRLGLAALRIED